MISTGIRYNSELQLMVSEVKKTIDKEILPIIKKEAKNYTADAWPERIEKAISFLLARWSSNRAKTIANRIASTFVRSSLQYADRKNRRLIGIDVYQNSEKLTNYLQAATLQNAQLIQSIPQRYIENVSNTVLAGMRTGLRPEVIAEQLREDYGITQRRARFIARDQSAKVSGEITKQRQIDAGFVYFKWIDSHDQRVRHRHREIANADVGYGKGIYRWDDLPKNDKGEPIQPGSDYGCRCTSMPVRTSAVEKQR